MSDNKRDYKIIENLKKEIQRYSGKTSYVAYCLKGNRMEKLFLITKDFKDLDDAIEAYTNAIKVEESSDAYCNRANLYCL